jgi:hypothetical protein
LTICTSEIPRDARPDKLKYNRFNIAQKMNNKITYSLYIYLALLFLATEIKAASLEYYFGENHKFNPAIPSPEAFLGYQTGTHHTRYDQLEAYFSELARVSENADLRVIGYTHGGRPILVLIISSSKNLLKLEEIRVNHLKITDPTSSFDHSTLPTINILGFGVHGNESSAAESAILTAYYLLASEGPEAKNFLEKGIFFIEPSRNPDGHDRHAVWVNAQKSKNLVSDPADLEHNEAYPGGRGNHYWFDLNRDWLPAIHPESRARLAFYHSWIPHVTTCHHEMGTNSTFFFEPTKPVDRESPIVPRSHYELNNRFSSYYANALDQIGSLYYTKEDFDNFNPTFGSSYPDYNGSLAILFEQASSRGYVQDRTVGEITFEAAIRNQLAVSIATIKASTELKKELTANQKEFFRTAFENGARARVKGYLFGDSQNLNLNLRFVELLKMHRIEVYENDKAFTAGSRNYLPGKSYVVPTEQAQNRLVELFFNKDISVPDSVFYDGSTWTVALAYGLPYTTLSDKNLFTGKKPMGNLTDQIVQTSKSSYAYLVRWNDYNSPAFLSKLLKHDIDIYAALKPFSAEIANEIHDFGYGTLVIPVTGQKITSDALHKILTELGAELQLIVYATETGYNAGGIDLGSNNVKPVLKPGILILTGRGISPLETGEAWYLIDNYLDMAVTRSDFASLDRLNLNRYTTIILPGTDSRSGNLINEKAAIARLKSWIAEGGTFIALNRASEWVIDNDLVNEKLVVTKQDTGRQRRFDFAEQFNIEGAKIVGGTILNIDIDTTHPVGFGFTQRQLPVLKNNTLAVQFSASPYNTVAAFEKKPLVSGYISGENLQHLSNTAAVIISPVQRGRVILFSFNPIHRASWHSSARLFYNSIFFSQLTGSGQVRYRANGSE